MRVTRGVCTRIVDPHLRASLLGHRAEGTGALRGGIVVTSLNGGEDEAKKTITRADLTEAVHRRVGLSRTESADMVEMVLDEIGEALVRGEQVKLSSFATFQVRHKNERIGRNPKTGEEVPISPRRVMTFRASNVLKDRIMRGHSPRNGKA